MLRANVSSVIWSATGFSPLTNALPLLRCWPAAPDEVTWSPSTRYADDTQIYGFSDPSDAELLMHCKSTWRSALMKFSPGWCPTSCSLILSRPRCSGVHPLDVGIRSRLVLLVLVTRVLRVRTVRDLGSTLMQMSAWVLTSLQSSKCVLLHSHQIRSVRCLLTRTTLLTLVHTLFPDNCYNGCSLSSTPPLVSCSRRGSRST